MKIKIGKGSIKRNITLGFIAFCAVLLVTLWLTQVVYLEDFYKAIKVRQVKSNAVNIEEHIDDAGLTEYIDDISLKSDICVDILSESGEIIASAHSDTKCFIHTLRPEERKKMVSDALGTDEAAFGYYDRRSFDFKPGGRWPQAGFVPPMPDESQALVYSKAVDSEKGRVVLIVNSVIAPVDATVATIRTQLYIFSAVTMLAGVVFALYIARKVARPIVAINEQAKLLKKGEYDVTFEGKGYMEIEELSDTLTSTARELNKVETLRRELIANVSHDLRTPLTLISGYAEMMRDLPGENSPENAQIILDETKRLTSLVTDMLDMSKLQSGTMVLKSEPFSITDMCENVIGRVSAMLKSENYDFLFEREENVTVNGDEQQLMQALYNLLTNAVNYTGEDRKITVTQKCTENTVRIEVKDTGEGIAEEELPYIWDRYYKSKASHKRAKIGTGLGLSIVRSVTELHGGRCGAQSEAGKGSVFWFELERQ